MKILYSDIRPLRLEAGQSSVSGSFKEQIANCDGLDIAVGYVSRAALKELDDLIAEYNIRHIGLVIGMYYAEGGTITRGLYQTALALSKKWKAAGIGEIRVTTAFKYHGKLYAFCKNDVVKTAIIGSANLGAIKLDNNNRKQYEVSAFTDDTAECNEIFSLIQKLQEDSCSVNIADITDWTFDQADDTSPDEADVDALLLQTNDSVLNDEDSQEDLAIYEAYFANLIMQLFRLFSEGTFDIRELCLWTSGGNVAIKDDRSTEIWLDKGAKVWSDESATSSRYFFADDFGIPKCRCLSSPPTGSFTKDKMYLWSYMVDGTISVEGEDGLEILFDEPIWLRYFWYPEVYIFNCRCYNIPPEGNFKIGSIYRRSYMTNKKVTIVDADGKTFLFDKSEWLQYFRIL